MTRAQEIVLEYEASVPVTRRHLERIPDDKLTWRPDPKSMTLGQLGLHLAASSGGISEFIRLDNVEMPDFGFPEPASTAEILSALDEAATKVRANLWNYSDADMAGSCNFVANGHVVMTFPRTMIARDILLNHNYHHRGQLSVYLRLLGVPVPISFGPTADEEMGMPE